MRQVVKGIVLREVKTGEADRILTIFTDKLGIISASAKNSLRMKSRLLTSTALFSYSEFTLFEGKSMFSVDDAETQKIFYGINESIEALSLAMYISEAAQSLLPPHEPNEELLSLVLNSFYCVSNKKYPLKLIKAVFEMRSISIAGFMPDLLSCAACEKFESDAFLFNYTNGDILCAECAEKASLKPNINGGVLAALRHIIYCEPKKLFAFALKDECMPQLCEVCENYFLTQTERSFKTLEFLKTML